MRAHINVKELTAIVWKFCLNLLVVSSVYSAAINTTEEPEIQAAPDLSIQNSGGCSENNLNAQKNITATGRDLWCYQCEGIYKKVYDPYGAACLNNLSAIVIRQCNSPDTYCKVERLDIMRFGRVQRIFRGCAESCFYGCRYYGYGLSYQKCTSCCNTYGCNSDNGQPALRVQPLVIATGALMLACIQLMLHK